MNDPFNTPQGPTPPGDGPTSPPGGSSMPPFGGAPTPPPPRPPTPKRHRWPFWARLLVVMIVAGVLFGITALVLGAMALARFSSQRAPTLSFGDRIGLVRIEGLIQQGPDKAFWEESLGRLLENDRVKGIVVRIDSPGGSIGASQELYETLAEVRQHKRVYVSMGDVAASGGYYIASAAERVFALKGTLTGSIGVIFTKPQIGELARKIGYETEVVKSGHFKDSGSIMRPLRADEREMFDRLIANALGQFKDDVLAFRAEPIERACREISPETWRQWQFGPTQPDARGFLDRIADGRVYSGQQALKLGLIDEIGTLDHTIDALTHNLGYETLEVIEPEREKSFRDLFQAGARHVMAPTHARLQYLMTLP